jgi:hypothetical protein
MTNEIYYIRSGQGNWEPTNAKTLQGAKTIATKSRRTLRGNLLSIGKLCNSTGEIKTVSEEKFKKTRMLGPKWCRNYKPFCFEMAVWENV